MENIYCLSGLGADERIFKNLKVEGAHLIFLPWLPFDKQDDMPSYAKKMATLIPEKNPIILGLSFGGMLASEISLQMPVKKAFLISTTKTKNELPEVNRMIKFLIRNNLIPYQFFKKPNSILYNLFGASAKEEKQLLAAIMKDTDIAFVGWAFKTILNWQNMLIPPNFIHIHGTDDRILQPEFVNADYWIDGGSHIMIYNRADEINKIISENMFN